MKTMQATDAKNRFGELLEDAISEPVLIQKNGRDVAVVVLTEVLGAQGDAFEVDLLVAALAEGVDETFQDLKHQAGTAMEVDDEPRCRHLGVAVGGGALRHQHQGIGAALAGIAGQLFGQGSASEAIPGFGHILLVEVLGEAAQLVVEDGEREGR